MKNFVGFALLLIASASLVCASPVAPEIDASSSVGALTLLSGALLVIRGRRKK